MGSSMLVRHPGASVGVATTKRSSSCCRTTGASSLPALSRDARPRSTSTPAVSLDVCSTSVPAQTRRGSDSHRRLGVRGATSTHEFYTGLGAVTPDVCVRSKNASTAHLRP
jgi:hypothetical protein